MLFALGEQSEHFCLKRVILDNSWKKKKSNNDIDRASSNEPFRPTRIL